MTYNPRLDVDTTNLVTMLEHLANNNPSNLGTEDVHLYAPDIANDNPVFSHVAQMLRTPALFAENMPGLVDEQMLGEANDGTLMFSAHCSDAIADFIEGFLTIFSGR